MDLGRELPLKNLVPFWKYHYLLYPNNIGIKNMINHQNHLHCTHLDWKLLFWFPQALVAYTELCYLSHWLFLVSYLTRKNQKHLFLVRTKNDKSSLSLLHFLLPQANFLDHSKFGAIELLSSYLQNAMKKILYLILILEPIIPCLLLPENFFIVQIPLEFSLGSLKNMPVFSTWMFFKQLFFDFENIFPDN